MEYIISQCIFAIAYIFLIVSFKFKQKDMIILFALFANVLFIAGYSIIGAWVVLSSVIISFFRLIAFFVLAKKNVNHWIFLVLIELITVFAALYTWNGWTSVIVLIGYAVYTYGCWQNNRLVILITNLVLSVALIAYNAIILNIMPIIMESVFFVLSILMYIRSNKVKQDDVKL